ncbi:MAG: fibronectin type III domain-containing protein, partial [Candidatus Omnitrophica bacterium]|nr:fibronectin type III domain-containing protein [Candidatus Omnitrophota bacterium]
MIYGFGAGIAVEAAQVTRSPYLQQTVSDSAIIVWRTDTATDSWVQYGTALGSQTYTASSSILDTFHQVKLTGLQSETIYYYSIGSTSGILAGGVDYVFTTAPTIGSATPLRIWVIGDAGTANSNQAAVRNAMVGEIPKSGDFNLWLMLGDNA